MRAAGTDIIYCSGLVPEKFAGLARPLGKLTINCQGSCVVCWKGAEENSFYFAVAGGYTGLHFVRCSKLGESTCKTKSSPINAPGMK